MEGGKQKIPEENPQSTREINSSYNSTHMNLTMKIRLLQLVTHPNTSRIWLDLTSVVRGNMLISYTTTSASLCLLKIPPNSTEIAYTYMDVMHKPFQQTIFGLSTDYVFQG